MKPALRIPGPALLAAGVAFLASSASAIDMDGDGLNDVWELVYSAQSLSASGDADGDGVNNLDESDAGTDPFDGASRPTLAIAPLGPDQFQLAFEQVAGKRYRLESSFDLSSDSWSSGSPHLAPGAGLMAWSAPAAGASMFWRLAIDDIDSDADGLLDAEERWLGFDPKTNRSDRYDTTDLARATAGIAAASVVTVSALDDRMSERWPDPGVVVLRRSGGLAPLTVNVAFSGTALRDADFTTPGLAGEAVAFGAGVREVPVELAPVADADDGEAAETIILSALPGAAYSLGAATSASVILDNETATSPPSPKAAARFLLQAAFGPDQDTDADGLPENVEEVMSMGFEAWIDDQFNRPLGLLQPWTEWQAANGNSHGLYGRSNQYAWWNRVMGVPKLRPDAATTQLPDP
ncbi:MAG: hypothetical protein KDN05_04860, partial [Verrucomicrobiae bacterium]|nr:hypothetical protein [Verrucomicrobiae bacterium]